MMVPGQRLGMLGRHRRNISRRLPSPLHLLITNSSSEPYTWFLGNGGPYVPHDEDCGLPRSLEILPVPHWAERPFHLQHAPIYDAVRGCVFLSRSGLKEDKMTTIQRNSSWTTFTSTWLSPSQARGSERTIIYNQDLSNGPRAPLCDIQTMRRVRQLLEHSTAPFGGGRMK